MATDRPINPHLESESNSFQVQVDPALWGLKALLPSESGLSAREEKLRSTRERAICVASMIGAGFPFDPRGVGPLRYVG